MKKKFLWFLVIVVVICLILFGLKKGGVIWKEEGTKISAEKAARRTITETVTASGKIYPETEVKMSPDVSGEIVELDVMEGDSVKKGQRLARIYADIYGNQRNQAAAQVQAQEALVSNVSATLPGLKASLDAAQSQYDRQKQLLSQKVISQAEFETATTTLRTAQANYAAAQQSVLSNRATASSAKSNLAIQSENLSRTTLVSPIDGVVSLLSVKKGERVVGSNMMSGTEMMRVADMSRIEAIVDVGENDIPKVHIGDSATVDVDAYNGRHFYGIVTQIASSIVASASSSSSSSSTSTDVTNYKVHIRLNPASYKDLIDHSRAKTLVFRPGMTASADIMTKTHTNVLSVPINSVTTREKSAAAGPPGKAAPVNASATQNDPTVADEEVKPTGMSNLDEVVFLVQPNGTVKKVNVATGIQDINYIEITKGLADSAKVVTGPYGTISKVLADSMKVKEVPKEQLVEAKP